mgnify:FL=1
MRGTKTGGRQAGTPNKVTSELRDALKAIVAHALDTLSDSLAQLPAKERLDVVIRLMPYCMPKVESIGGQYDTGIMTLDW